MIGNIQIQANEQEKLHLLISRCNQSRGCSLSFIGYANGQATIKAQSMQEVFILGRMFQVFKAPSKMGCFTIEQDETELTQI